MLARQGSGVPPDRRLVEVRAGRLDADAPPSGHRVARVDDEVENDLLDLARVCPSVAHVRTLRDDEHDVFADGPPQHLLHAADDRVELEDDGRS